MRIVRWMVGNAKGVGEVQLISLYALHTLSSFIPRHMITIHLCCDFFVSILFQLIILEVTLNNGEFNFEPNVN